MAEYIEREAILEKIEQMQDGLNALMTRGEWNGLQAAVDAVLCVPAADVAPVVYGHWISLTECANAGVYCSVCNKKVYKEDYAWSNKRIKMRSNYCPNCGANMKDGEG